MLHFQPAVRVGSPTGRSSTRSSNAMKGTNFALIDYSHA